MPENIYRINLNAVPDAVAALTPPDRRLTVDNPPGGEIHSLNLSFRLNRPSLTILKDPATGMITEVLAKPAPKLAPTPHTLLLNRNSNPHGFANTSVWELAHIAFRETGEAAARASAPPGQQTGQAASATAGQCRVAKTARQEAKAWLTAKELNRINRQVRAFMDEPLCRLADKCYGKSATHESLNFIIETGRDTVAQLVKTDPKTACISMACLSMAFPYYYPRHPASAEDLRQRGLHTLDKAAAAAGLPDAETRHILNRIDLNSLRNRIRSEKALITMLRLAAAVEHDIPDPIMGEWIRQINQPGVRSKLAPAERRDHDRIAVFQEACRLRQEQPGRHDHRSLVQALQRLEFSLGKTPANGATPQQRLNAEAERITRLREVTAANRPPITPARKPPNGNELRHRVEEAWRDDDRRHRALQAAASSSAQVTPAAVTVTAGVGGPLLYEVSRNEAGAITFNPPPGDHVMVDAEGRLIYGQGHLLPAMNAAAAATALALLPDLPRNPEAMSLIEAATAVRCLDSLLDNPQLDRLDLDLSVKTTRAVNRLISREAVNRAFLATGQSGDLDAHISIIQYNAARLAGASLEELAETNPGAAAWLMLACPAKIAVPVNHPGQLVNIARKDTGWPKSGPAHRPPWKTLAATNPEVLRHIAPAPGRSQAPALQRRLARTVVAAAAAAGRRRLTHEMAAICERLASAGGIQPDNDVPLLVHCFNEPQAAADHADELIDIRDYCRANRPTATTFNGLLKASHKWHRDIQEIQRREGLEQRKFLQWDSAIDSITLENGITATALTDTIMLGIESRRQNHCVFQYDEYCAKGRNRIFHLSTGATAQLLLQQHGQWTAGQVRRNRNHPALEAEKEAAAELAILYTEAARTPRRRRRQPDP